MNFHLIHNQPMPAPYPRKNILLIVTFKKFPTWAKRFNERMTGNGRRIEVAVIEEAFYRKAFPKPLLTPLLHPDQPGCPHALTLAHLRKKLFPDSPAPRLDGIARGQALRHLENLMKDISEDCYCATWMSGLERELWRLMLQHGGPYGMGEVTVGQALELRNLHEALGGWLVWDVDGGYENPDTKFVTTAEWLEIYRKPAVS